MTNIILILIFHLLIRKHGIRVQILFEVVKLIKYIASLTILWVTLQISPLGTIIDHYFHLKVIRLAKLLLLLGLRNGNWVPGNWILAAVLLCAAKKQVIIVGQQALVSRWLVPLLIVGTILGVFGLSCQQTLALRWFFEPRADLFLLLF